LPVHDYHVAIPRGQKGLVRGAPMPTSMAKRATSRPGSSFELYAQAMLDHWLGKKVTVEFERDDGYRDRSDLPTYFASSAKWFPIEREAMREVRGRVLDVGCGPGRHALYLQRRGFRVVGIDASPTQVALARVRGLNEVYQASTSRLPRGLGTFDTVLLMGNNFGLAGNLPRMRKFLRELAEITGDGGRIVGHTRIPGTWIDHHLAYVKRNVARGRPPGLLTLRVRYKGRVGDWFELLLLSPDDLVALAHETGWDFTRMLWRPDAAPSDYIAILEKR